MRRVLALAWLLLMLAAVLAAPLLTDQDPLQPTAPALAAAGSGHPLGADHLGRDLLSRLLYGGRTSLLMAAIAGAIAVAGGSFLGAWAAVAPRTMDSVLIWAGNVLLAIPGLLLAMLLVASFGTSRWTVILAAGISAIPNTMRVARTLLKQTAQEEYVQAARAIGATRLRIARRHILPNARPRLLVLAITQLAWSFVNTTTLSFLGFAGDPSLPEWGAMLNSGRGYLLEAPQLALLPGLAISFTILALHHLGSTPVHAQKI